IVFSTKNPMGTQAADNLLVVTKDNTTVVSKASLKTIDAGNLEVDSPDGQSKVLSGVIASGNNTDNAKGVSILMKNAYPKVNKLVEDYLKARLTVDKDKISQLVDNVYYAGIEELPKMMKNFESIKLADCYTIDGPEEGAMMVYAKTETKIKGIDTPASGVDGFYIKPDANGDLRIVLSPVANEVQKIIDEDTKREDVVALLSDVNTKLAHEIKSDEKLATFFSKLKNRQAGSDEEINLSGKNNKRNNTVKHAKNAKKSKNKKSN
ncbi:MAG: hypothetical protein ACFNTU_05775, partial [Catonella sp.]